MGKKQQQSEFGIDWEELGIEHIGISAEDGLSVLEEVNEKIQQNARLCMNEMHTDKAKIVVTIEIARQGDGIVIDAVVKENRPRRRRRAVMAMADRNGNFMVQKADQLALPMQGRNVVEEALRASEGRGE